MAVIEIKFFCEYLKRHAEYLVWWEDYEPQPSEAHSSGSYCVCQLLSDVFRQAQCLMLKQAYSSTQGWRVRGNCGLLSFTNTYSNLKSLYASFLGL